MKLLFDQSLNFKLCQALADLFPGSSQVRLLGLAEADDRTVWQHAQANAFVLVTRLRLRRNGRAVRPPAKGDLASLWQPAHQSYRKPPP